MLRKDEDGFYPLSVREYAALRQMFGFVNVMDEDALKERLKTIPSGWRDMRMMAAVSKHLVHELLTTVPIKKRLSIQSELRNTVCEIKFKPPSSKMEDCVVISRKALVRLMERAIDMDCLFCDKSLNECKRCTLYKDLNACFPYELAEPTDNKCLFAGVSGLEAEE